MWGKVKKKVVMQPCEKCHKNRFFFSSYMLWPVPFGSPARMLMGMLEKISWIGWKRNLEGYWKGRDVTNGNICDCPRKGPFLHYFDSSRCSTFKYCARDPSLISKVNMYWFIYCSG